MWIFRDVISEYKHIWHFFNTFEEFHTLLGISRNFTPFWEFRGISHPFGYFDEFHTVLGTSRNSTLWTARNYTLLGISRNFWTSRNLTLWTSRNLTLLTWPFRGIWTWHQRNFSLWTWHQRCQSSHLEVWIFTKKVWIFTMEVWHLAVQFLGRPSLLW